MARNTSGGLSTGERLSSRNPAVRREVQREISQGKISTPSRSGGGGSSGSSGTTQPTSQQVKLPISTTNQISAWKRVGTSSLGTPIYERTIGSKTERIATSKTPTNETKGFEVQKQSTKIGATQQISEQRKNQLVEQARQQEAKTKINRAIILQQLLDEEQAKQELERKTAQQKIYFTSQQRKSTTPKPKSIVTPLNNNVKSEAQLRGEKALFEQEKKEIASKSFLYTSPAKFLKFKAIEAGIIKPEYEKLEKSAIQQATERYTTKYKETERVGERELFAEEFGKREGKRISEELQQFADAEIMKESERIQKKSDLKFKELQAKVDSGELTVDQAKEKLEVYKEGLEKFSQSRQKSVERRTKQATAQELAQLDKKFTEELTQKGLAGSGKSQVAANITQKAFEKSVQRSKASQKEVEVLESQGVKASTDVGLLNPDLVTGTDTSPLLGDLSAKQRARAFKKEEAEVEAFKAGFIRDPLRTAKGVAVGFITTTVGTPLLAGGGALAKTATVGGSLLTGAFAVGAGAEISSQQKQLEKNIAAGEVAAELTGFSAGAALGIPAGKGALKAKEYLTEKGRAEIAVRRASQVEELKFSFTEPQTKINIKEFSKIEFAGKPAQEVFPSPETPTRLTQATISSGGSPTVLVNAQGKKITGAGIIKDGVQRTTFKTKIGKQDYFIQQTAEIGKPTQKIKVFTEKGLVREFELTGGKKNLPFPETKQISKIDEQIIKTKDILPRTLEISTEVRGSEAILPYPRKSRLFKSTQFEQATLTQSNRALRSAEAITPSRERLQKLIGERIGNEANVRVDLLNERLFSSTIEFIKGRSKPPSIKQEFAPVRETSFSASKNGKKVDVNVLEQEILTKEPAKILTKQTGLSKVEIKLRKQRLKSTLEKLLGEKKGQARLETETEILEVPRETLKPTSVRLFQFSKIAPSQMSRIGISNLPKILTASQSALKAQPKVSIQTEISKIIESRVGDFRKPVIGQLEKQLINIRTPPDLPIPRLDIDQRFTQPNPSIRAPPIDVFIPPFVPLPVRGKPLVGFGSGAFRQRQRPVKELLEQSQSFTAKALGLAPLKVTKAQAKKILETPLTGFEIRRGLIIQ